MSQTQTQIQSQINPRSSAATPSNILGATGQSRAALAALFRRDGLFGRDSDLTPAEQAIVQSGLPKIGGLKDRGQAIRSTPRLAALADYVEALVAGRAAVGERARAEAAGLGSRAASEVATIVENVFTVFRPEREVPAAARPATVAPEYARAA